MLRGGSKLEIMTKEQKKLEEKEEEISKRKMLDFDRKQAERTTKVSFSLSECLTLWQQADLGRKYKEPYKGGVAKCATDEWTYEANGETVVVVFLSDNRKCHEQRVGKRAPDRVSLEWVPFATFGVNWRIIWCCRMGWSSKYLLWFVQISLEFKVVFKRTRSLPDYGQRRTSNIIHMGRKATAVQTNQNWRFQLQENTTDSFRINAKWSMEMECEHQNTYPR
jgi:hypothetical protein